MRAAQITELGRPPEPTELEGPVGDGEEAVEIELVALNPLDLAVGAGRHYLGHPPLPYVPGCEGAGRSGGQLVYVFGSGLGTTRDGTLAQGIRVPATAVSRLPEGSDLTLAVVSGIAGIAAWAPVTRRAEVGEGDRVLVLGATGTVGLVAVQAAKLRGAARVVAAGRNRERLELARELGADETVELRGDGDEARFRDAFDGEGPSVVIDPLWGAPVAAAAEAAAPGARIVNIGASAGAEATFTSAAVRSKQLNILGHTNFALSPAARARLHLELLEHVLAGRIRIEFERFPLDRVADAWQATAAGTKAVVEL